MANDEKILRIFEVTTKQGCARQLLENFATTSAAVVLGHPGNEGYFFGETVQGAPNTVMFVSVWKNLDAVKARFGAEWQVSYLPEGYEDLIEACSIRHVNVADGWHV